MKLTLIEKCRINILLYFSNNICPHRFSLSSEKAKDNDFYEVHIYIPEATNDEIATISKINRSALKIKYEFIPSKSSKNTINTILGIKKSPDEAEFSEHYLPTEATKYARIDVTYYYGMYQFQEQHCDSICLLKLFSYRKLKLIHFRLALHRLKQIVNRWRMSKIYRTPLKSKFEIYEALMKSDDFLWKGTFKKSELSKLLFGNHSIVEYKLFKTVSQSLDWILEACESDGEIQKLPNRSDETDPTYRMKGKGIHYFTLTKEKIKADENNRIIQHQQVKIQRGILWMTGLLVIGTFLSAVDKVNEINTILRSSALYLGSLISKIITILT